MKIVQIIVDELPENCIKCSLHWCPLATQNVDDTIRHPNCRLMPDKEWFCTKCRVIVPDYQVTFHEYHEGCGGKCV